MESRGFKVGLFMLPLLTQGGGAEKYFIELARNLNERGIQLEVITMDENFFRKFARLLHIFTRGNFFGKIDISGRESEDEISKQLGKARWIKTNFKNLGRVLGEYDVVYTKNELVDLFLLKFIGYRNLPPVVAGIHTPVFYPEAKSFLSKLHNFLYLSSFYRWLLKGMKGIHVSNKSTKDIIENRFNLKSWLIYYPFSPDAVASLAKENISGLSHSTEKKNIIFAGRLGEQKGIEFLIDIIGRIKRDAILQDLVMLNIFGSGDKKYETEIKTLAEKHPFVQYFGHVENKYMPHVLSQQDLMIVPSKWETLPYSVLETQSMGVPVVAFDIPGPNDIIGNEKTGFLASSKDDFFEKMKIVARGEVSFERDVIIQNVEKKFNPEKIYSELAKMFQDSL